MNVDNLQQVQALITEKQSIQTALRVFAEGGRIVGMTLGTTTGTPTGPVMNVGASVSTSYISYPAQMVDAIQKAFHDRLWAIGEELAKLDVTGM